MGKLFLGSRNLLLVLVHGRQDVGVVNHRGAKSARVEEEDEEAELENEVEWDEVQDEAAPLVDDVEHAKDHPVRKPLLVVISAVTL